MRIAGSMGAGWRGIQGHVALTLLLSIGFFGAFVGTAPVALALDGELRVHDPSTVVMCKGKYYLFSTGPGIPILSSEDGFTWQRSGRVLENVPESVHSLVPFDKNALVWAPDITFLNGQYFLYYSISSWGSFTSAVGLVTSPTLDANDPTYKWTDRGLVVNSVEPQNLNAIDPGVVKTPDGGLWISYGSYHGNIELLQLDPVTGVRISKNSQVYIVTSYSEASDIVYHGGYYYLLVNHDGCCKGKESTYNIRVGRSKKVTGPYLDKYNVDMKEGGGSLFLAAHGTQIGPGHFGLLTVDGVEKFSCYYEADMARGGSPALDIQPLSWDDQGWPVAGENPGDTPYQLLSKRTERVLEYGKGEGSDANSIRQGPYISLDSQKWSLGEAGQGYYKIVESEGTYALEAVGAESAASGHLNAGPYTGADSQLWKVDQLSDGSYRIVSKSTQRAMTAGTGTTNGDTIQLESYTGEDSQRWLLVTP
jgi:arabinan endo-1,5-alpha-L-arabinosidase